MHRSGTSAISRIVSLLGVHLGAPGALLEPYTDNPKGFWEHSRIVQINDEILERFGGRWNAPPVFPAGWASSAEIADLRDTARQLLASEFGGEPLWGWKDPRTCLTLPFWQEVIGSLRYLLVVRNPAAVVASLYKRNQMSAVDAEGLWLAYIQASLAHTAGHPRAFVFFDDLLRDLPGELRRLAAFIGRPEMADDPGLREAINDFIENGLWHHRRSAEDLIADGALSFEVKGLYLAILAHATEQRSIDWQPEAGSPAQVDLLAHEALRTWTRAQALAAEREVLDRERLAQADEHEQLTADYARVSAACERLGTRGRAPERRARSAVPESGRTGRSGSGHRDGTRRPGRSRGARSSGHRAGRAAWRRPPPSAIITRGCTRPSRRRCGRSRRASRGTWWALREAPSSTACPPAPGAAGCSTPPFARSCRRSRATPHERRPERTTSRSSCASRTTPSVTRRCCCARASARSQGRRATRGSWPWRHGTGWVLTDTPRGN